MERLRGQAADDILTSVKRKGSVVGRNASSNAM